MRWLGIETLLASVVEYRYMPIGTEFNKLSGKLTLVNATICGMGR